MKRKQIKDCPPLDVVALCEEIARGYERRRKDYTDKRLEIIHAGGSVIPSECIGGSRGSGVSDPVARKAERLEKLEDSLDAKFLRAVEQSMAATGGDVARDLRERLRKAIILNCESGRDYPYEMLNIDEFSRRDFYRRKKTFVIGIGEILGLV